MAQFYSHPEREGNPHALPDCDVFYVNRTEARERNSYDEEPTWQVGWYYWFCFPGCMPDGDPIGPFATEAEAIADAREFAGG